MYFFINLLQPSLLETPNSVETFLIITETIIVPLYA